MYCTLYCIQSELKKIIDPLNNVHKSIKFTATWSPTENNFLDTAVKVDPHRKLYTTLYRKRTDTHTYLHYNSYTKKEWAV